MSCPDGVSLARFLLLPDDAVTVSQRHDHTSADSLEQALRMLRDLGYTEEQLLDIRQHLTQPAHSQESTQAVIAA